jgi:hypothetical protein
MNTRLLLLAFAALAVIWGGVAAVLQATEKHTSTPEKVLGLMGSAPWIVNDSATPEARRQRVSEVIAQVNLLDFDQRRQLREGDQNVSKQFFDTLEPEEKGRFLKETVEQHFKSVMKAFNQMAPEERKRLVKQAQADMQRNRVEGQNMEKLKAEDEKVFQTVVEKGLGAYYEEANAETKMDLAPLMEEMQQRLRGFPNR